MVLLTFLDKSSNRTFMELKYERIADKTNQLKF